MKKHNRLFALLLAIAMVVTYMPAMAFAEDAESDKAKASEVEQADPVDATVDDETNTTQEELTKEPAVSEKEMMSTASLEDGEIAQSEWLADDVESIEFSPAGDTNRFVFRQDVREKVREQFGLNDAYVIGHIGRFNHQKNQDRLIGILMEVLQIRQDAVLMLCGKGELENEFQEKAKHVKSPFGDGSTSDQIVEHILDFLCSKVVREV